MITIGIDPGLDGAIAVLRDTKLEALYDMPTLKVGKKREPAVSEIAKELGRYQGLLWPELRIGIEHVHAMPKQGVTSTFRFGYGYGLLVGIIAATGFPFERVTPQRWKRDMLHGLPKAKHASLLRARELFPAADLRLAKHHGRADALLIAEWLRRQVGT